MINKIWASLIIIGILFSLLTGNLNNITTEILKSGETSFNLITKMFPVIALWLGIMNIALKSGLLNKLSNFFKPILKKIFPEIPSNHESLGYITTNIVMNMFGLGNAATPSGLKAMKSLQTLNNSDTASRSMITFLVINTSGVTLIPTTVISLRMLYNSIAPTSIILGCIIVTIISLVCGLIFDRILWRLSK